MSEENTKSLEERLRIAQCRADVAGRFYKAANKSIHRYRIALFLVSAVAVGLAASSCSSRSLRVKEVVPYFVYEQSARVEIESPGTYSIQARPDGIVIFPVNEEKK